MFITNKKKYVYILVENVILNIFEVINKVSLVNDVVKKMFRHAN